MPVEPDNGIGDGAGSIPATTNNSNSTNDIQSLLQNIDPDDISLLLQTISPDQLAEMLQQQSGLAVSADEITQLLQQLQDGGNDNTDIPSTPIPVEANNGIGDSLGQIDTPPVTTTSDANNQDASNVDQILQNIDPALLSELLQMVSLDELASMLQEESGISISAEQIQQLLDQTGLTNATAVQMDSVSSSSTSTAETTSTNSDDRPNTDSASNDNQNVAPTETNNTTTTSNDSSVDSVPVNTEPANTEEVQNLLQEIDSSGFASFFDLFSAEQLAEILNQEGTNISADEVRTLLSQIGLSA